MKLIWIKITTEGNFIAELGDVDGTKELYFIDKAGGEPRKIDEEEMSKTSIVRAMRSDANAYQEIAKLFGKKEEIQKDFMQVDEIYGNAILMKKWDITAGFFVQDDEDIVPLSGEVIAKLKSDAGTIKKLKSSMKPAVQSHKLGDRVLLYGPTGTGKTFDFLSNVEAMMKKKEIDDFDILTITEGFEDIDFLAYIVPTPTGIKYTEKKIVSLLRDASKGKKVAILLDELNRGGKSFLNLILKLLDAVDGKNYILSNFIADEQIVIPIENVMFFGTMNLWGKYVGTNALDEALFDRWNKVLYKGYNLDVEKDIAKNFGALMWDALNVIKYVREIHASGEIRAPISTRWVKMWCENFINTGKTKDDFLESFNTTLLNRLTSVDDFGNPNGEEMALIMKKFRDLKYI